MARKYSHVPFVSDYRTSYNYLCSKVTESENLLAKIIDGGDTFRIDAVKRELKIAKKKVQAYDAKHPRI